MVWNLGIVWSKKGRGNGDKVNQWFATTKTEDLLRSNREKESVVTGSSRGIADNRPTDGIVVGWIRQKEVGTGELAQ